MNVDKARTLLAVMVGGLLAGLAMTGCERPTKQRTELASPMLAAGAQPTLEVVNPAGPVRVEVDPRVAGVVVDSAIAPPPGSDMESEEAAQHVRIETETLGEGPNPTVRIVAYLDEMEGPPPRVALKVRIPAVHGVSVRNAGGQVELVGVAGPLEVQSGVGGGPGGRVVVRTDEPIRDPVTLTSSEGPVLLQMGLGSAGRLDLASAQGEAQFIAHGGRVDQARATGDRWVGILNGGANPIVLRGGRGTVRATVMENPRAYVPSRFMN